MNLESSLRLWIGLLVLWLVAGAAAFALIDDGPTMPLGWALLAFVAAAVIVRPFEHAGPASALVASLAYGGLELARTVSENNIDEANYLPLVALGAGVFMATVLVGNAISGAIDRVRSEVAERQRVVDELTSRDPVTGALKSAYAHGVVVEEIERARRYQRSLTLALIRPEGWSRVVEERGEVRAQQALADLGALLAETVRVVDKVIRYGDTTFALLLPETPLEGAHVVAEKVCRTALERIAVPVRAGIAAFPDDAANGDALLAEAEQALEFAETAQLLIASRALLS